MNLDELILRYQARRFRKRRAAYYQFLAELLAHTSGGKTLLAIFEDDASRYGPRHPRGFLSARWAQRYQQSGDLAFAFEGSIPADDVLVLRVAQRAGAGALADAFGDLARLAHLAEQARGILRSSLSSVVIGLAIVAGVLASIPLFVVPQLRDSFRRLPEDALEYGTGIIAAARNYFALSDFLASFGLPLLGLAVGGCALVGWSLSRYTGRFRPELDRVFPYSAYRSIQSIRFADTLACLVRPRGNSSPSLLAAIQEQMDGAPAWRAHHLTAMQRRILAGNVRVDALNTGLLDRESYWYLADLAMCHPVHEALHRMRDYVVTIALPQISRSATRVRYVTLISLVLLMVALLSWQYLTVYALSQAMATF